MNNPAQDSYQLYIGGEWVDASDGATRSIRFAQQLARSFPLLLMRHVRMLIVRLKLHGRHLPDKEHHDQPK